MKRYSSNASMMAERVNATVIWGEKRAAGRKRKSYASIDCCPCPYYPCIVCPRYMLSLWSERRNPKNGSICYTNLKDGARKKQTMKPESGYYYVKTCQRTAFKTGFTGYYVRSMSLLMSARMLLLLPCYIVHIIGERCQSAVHWRLPSGSCRCHSMVCHYCHGACPGVTSCHAHGNHVPYAPSTLPDTCLCWKRANHMRRYESRTMVCPAVVHKRELVRLFELLFQLVAIRSALMLLPLTGTRLALSPWRWLPVFAACCRHCFGSWLFWENHVCWRPLLSAH